MLRKVLTNSSPSARTALIQLGPLVEHVTVDRITTAPPLVEEQETHKYADTPADLAAKNLGGEASFLDGVLRHRQKRNGTLELLVQWAIKYEPTWEPRVNIH